MAEESLLNTNWNSGDSIVAAKLNAHGQEHIDLNGHGDAFHSVQYLKSLIGGDGITPASIGDGDTVSVSWADATALGPAGGLLTDSLTIAGNSVALGGSTGISHADLSNISSNDHHAKTSSASELSDVSADSNANAHHQEPTAGTGLTDEGTNQFGINLSAIAGDNLTADATNNELDASNTSGITSLTGGIGISPASIGDGDTLDIDLASIAGQNLSVDSTNNELDASGASGITSLSGGVGILPDSIGDGDTFAVDLTGIAGDNITVDGANNQLDATGSSGITSLSGGDGISPASIGDNDTLSVAWADASALGSTGGLLTDSLTIAGNSVALGGSTGIGHADLSNISSNDHHAKTSSASELSDVSADSASSAHHQDPTAGTGLTDEGTNQFGIASGGVTDTELGVESFSYDPGMTEFEAGLTNEEINRILLANGESLLVERIEFRQKGGGSSTNASIDVRDTLAKFTVASQTLGGRTKLSSSSQVGSTVVIRVNNSTGSAISAAPRVQGYIRGA